MMLTFPVWYFFLIIILYIWLDFQKLPDETVLENRLVFNKNIEVRLQLGIQSVNQINESKLECNLKSKFRRVYIVTCLCLARLSLSRRILLKRLGTERLHFTRYPEFFCRNSLSLRKSLKVFAIVHCFFLTVTRIKNSTCKKYIFTSYEVPS